MTTSGQEGRGGPRVHRIVLHSRDAERLLVFYETLGLKFVRERDVGGPARLFARAGDVQIEIFAASRLATAPGEMHGWLLELRVADLDRIVDQVEQDGHRVLSGPMDTPWGRRAVVIDPEGRTVHLSASRSDVDTQEYQSP